MSFEESATRLLRPLVLEISPSDPAASRTFKHWKRILDLTVSKVEEETIKQGILIRSLSVDNFEMVCECNTYTESMTILKNLFDKPPHHIMARHNLMTRKQKSGETICEYTRVLRILSQDCNFSAVDAITNREDYMRDAFIAGITSPVIRTRLLESSELTLKDAVEKAKALETAQKESDLIAETYKSRSYSAVTKARLTNSSNNNRKSYQPNKQKGEFNKFKENQNVSSDEVSKKRWTGGRYCYFCGSKYYHHRSKCPAKNNTCKKCSKIGHFPKVCKSVPVTATTRETSDSSSDSEDETYLEDQQIYNLNTTSYPNKLNSSSVKVSILYKNKSDEIKALVDTGSSENFIAKQLVDKLGLKTKKYSSKITMASINCTTSITECCKVVFTLQNVEYKEKFLVLPGSCADLILGMPFLNKHSSLTIKFKGKNKRLKIASLIPFKIDSPRLFTNLTPNCKPIATKSRKYSKEDTNFIKSEIRRM